MSTPRWSRLGLMLAVVLAGCSTQKDNGLPPAGVACSDLTPQPAIVTDIDETLTVSDAEWVTQLVDGDYVPRAREGSLELVRGYYDRGYRILYLTARPETLTLLNGTTAREATENWLRDLRFPRDADRTRLVLAPGPMNDVETAQYKQGAVEALMAEGWGFEYAYGNATTDASGYAGAGIPLDRTYIIGRNAGVGGTVAIAGEAWTDHITSHLDPMPKICDW